MNGLAFTAAIIQALVSLAWPAVILVIALMFRTEIRAQLSREPTRVKLGPFEAEWAQKSLEVEATITPRGMGAGGVPAGGLSENLQDLARSSPVSAIVSAFDAVEFRLRTRLQQAGVEPPPGIGAVGLARIAAEHNILPDEVAMGVSGIAVLRNLAVHSAGLVDEQRAREYLALADGILLALGGA